MKTSMKVLHSTKSRQDYIDYMKSLRDEQKFVKVTIADEQIEAEAEADIKMRHEIKPNFCINCWNKFEGESYALWKIYSDINQGIMIKSSFNSIIRAFDKTKETVYCSYIKYINYLTESVPIGNIFAPFVYKRVAYQYENEIRLIYQVAEFGNVFPWEDQPIENGIMVDVNLHELIREIVISPYAPKWFFEIVEDLCEKYKLECQVSFSELK